MLSCVIKIIFLINFVQSARILGVFQFPSLSHQIVYQTIWRELSLRGHEVVIVTPNPLNDPSLVNLTEIDVSNIYNTIAPSEGIEKTLSKDVSTSSIMRSFLELSNKLQDEVFQNNEFRKIYTNPNEKFDLILVELLHPGMYSLAGRFKAPVIGISSLGATVATHDSVGNPNHPVLFPEMNLQYHGKLTLLQKIYSIYSSLWLIYYYNYEIMPVADQIARKYLGNDIPYLGKLAKNVSMLFLNVNPVIYSRPNVPNVINLGFMHIRPPRSLPVDLQKILDDAKEGVIYFSLGSNVKSVNIPDHLRKTILSALSELPYTILWKWESDQLPGKPKNVITRKWLPQQDVLAHGNIKAFVTQGGLQSAEEAISRGVPVVGMPFIGDQPMNVKKLVDAGVALEVDPSTVTKDELKKAIVEVAENEKYKNKMMEVRDIVFDQPMTGLERAIWWSEYVIRHKGASHLRSPTADISWVEYLLLDVVAVLLTALLIVSYIVYKFAKMVVPLIRLSKKLKSVNYYYLFVNKSRKRFR